MMVAGGFPANSALAGGKAAAKAKEMGLPDDAIKAAGSAAAAAVKEGFAPIDAEAAGEAAARAIVIEALSRAYAMRML